MRLMIMAEFGSFSEGSVNEEGQTDVIPRGQQCKTPLCLHQRFNIRERPPAWDANLHLRLFLGSSLPARTKAPSPSAAFLECSS